MAAVLTKAVFFNRVRVAPFPGSLTPGQVSGMESLLDACPVDWSSDWLAYALATAFHETARTMLPIAEYGKGKGRVYGTPDSRTGQTYYGRGYVQLTWYDNYLRAGKALGVDFVGKPEWALDPDLAAAVMYRGMAEGWFTGKKLADYFSSTKSQPVEARRIINGSDKAALIATYFANFRAALTAAGHRPGAVAPAAPVPPVDVLPPPPVVAPAPAVGFWSSMLARLRVAYPPKG